MPCPRCLPTPEALPALPTLGGSGTRGPEGASPAPARAPGEESGPRPRPFPGSGSAQLLRWPPAPSRPPARRIPPWLRCPVNQDVPPGLQGEYPPGIPAPDPRRGGGPLGAAGLGLAAPAHPSRGATRSPPRRSCCDSRRSATWEAATAPRPLPAGAQAPRGSAARPMRSRPLPSPRPPAASRRRPRRRVPRPGVPDRLPGAPSRPARPGNRRRRDPPTAGLRAAPDTAIVCAPAGHALPQPAAPPGRGAGAGDSRGAGGRCHPPTRCQHPAPRKSSPGSRPVRSPRAAASSGELIRAVQPGTGTRLGHSERWPLPPLGHLRKRTLTCHLQVFSYQATKMSLFF
ncbi:proline-rich protein HaeIII subfamily 1-like [Chiroxiphia lanceolata]|uniref:proline-rich protein HaeIII subfamily 1-like n=1 Tax=Chiroxiphia lanceolata TaxID=296741 RepID=UPI0013CF1754|nr:proline-rich protein HaeIII subfamily 1-like [Chiroxiphia lanceolata]